jgi:hypothetical protein
MPPDAALSVYTLIGTWGRRPDRHMGASSEMVNRIAQPSRCASFALFRNSVAKLHLDGT